MDEQRQVAAFVQEHGLETPAAYRLLDVVSELGEVSKETLTSTAYGEDPGTARVSSDEVGDLLFAVLALAEELDIDAGDALEESLTKYEQRLEETGGAGSGE